MLSRVLWGAEDDETSNAAFTRRFYASQNSQRSVTAADERMET